MVLEWYHLFVKRGVGEWVFGFLQAGHTWGPSSLSASDEILGKSESQLMPSLQPVRTSYRGNANDDILKPLNNEALSN